MGKIRARILGTGHSYPEGILTNAELEKMVETSDEWITSRTGIKQRRKAAPGEYTSQFAVRAARQAIGRAGLQPEDIDLLLCATVTPDQILPSTGCIIQAELGANKASAMDLVAACSGFLYGLTVADSMIRSGQSKNAVGIGAEIRSDGRYLEQLFSPGGGTRRPPSAETLAAGDHFFKMKGNELFKVAVRSMTDISREVLEDAGLNSEDVTLFIPHQANQRITDAVANKLNVDSDRVYSNIAMHGNTSSASIPIGLDECVEAGRISEGDLVLLTSFGGGVTWGGVLIRW